MRRIALAVAALSLSLGLITAACSSGPPKQAEVPDVDKDTGQDIAGGEGTPAAAASGTPATEAPPEGDKMHEKCCTSCKEALGKDRSGAKANTIPCADFTADMDVFCIEHFRSKPTMASDCQ
jgi:hypothetical protein